MRIKILGIGSSTLDKYSSSCLVYTSKGNILIDVGAGILKKAAQEDLLNLTDILITHAHRETVAGIKELNSFLEKNNKFVNIYANQHVIKTIKLRWSSKNRDNYNFNTVSINKSILVNGISIRPVKVFHDKDYPTLAYSFDKVFFWGSELGPVFNDYKLEYLKDNILAVLDGCYWNNQAVNNHIAILSNLDSILSLNNKYVLFIGMGNQVPEFKKANKILIDKLNEYKKVHTECKVKEIRVAKEGEQLSIDMNKLLPLDNRMLLKPAIKDLLANPSIVRQSSNKEIVGTHLRLHQLWGIQKSEKILKAHIVIIKEFFRRGLQHKVVNNLDKKSYRLLGREIKAYEIWNELKDEVVIKSNIIKFVGAVLDKANPTSLDILAPRALECIFKQFLAKYNPSFKQGSQETELALNVYDLVLRKKKIMSIGRGLLPNYRKIYKACKLNKKLKFKADSYIVEPLIQGKAEIVVDREKRIIYERVITPFKREVITDLLAYRRDSLFKMELLNRLYFLHNKWLNKIDFKYLPTRWVVQKKDLFKFLKRIKNKYSKVIVRPSTSQYYEGKTIVILNTKADNLGRIPDNTGSTYLPKPTADKKKKPKRKKEGESLMRKEIDLPVDVSKPELLDKLIQAVLNVDVFKQATLEKCIPSYKTALYSKALDHFLRNKEIRVINVRWGEKYIPANYELLETNRDMKERLLVAGFILVKDKHPMLIHYRSGYRCQLLTIYSKKEDAETIESFEKQLDKYVVDNNYWRNEKITPLGRFLPLSNLKKEDVFLEEEIFTRLNKTVFNFFKNKEKYTVAKVPFKRGVIFAGLAGTGKTLSGKIIMNSIKDVTFIWVTARDFIDVGVSALFNMARELQPAILFIEDIDRCLTGPTLDSLKTQMDGLDSNEGILTLLSTNFPKQLPKTLIDRPGRFDDVIEFSLPNAQLRYAILQHYSKTINIVEKDITLLEVAKLSAGLTPAHLKELVISAYMSNDSEVLKLEDLQASLSRLKELHNKFKSLKKDITKARGDGQGNGGPRQGDGGAKVCICPKCKTEVAHTKGVPCNQSKCPKCGTSMIGKAQEVLKPAPDVTPNYIRWRIKNPDLFEKTSFRIIDLSKKQKIKAVIGKFKKDKTGPMHVQSVLFSKEKWTIEKAKAWIKEHKDSLKSATIKIVKK